MPSLMKKLVVICIVLQVALSLKAQLEPLYTMYSANGFLFNPAVAGADGYTTVGLAARDDMVGFDNSPKTYVLSAQGRILRKNVKVSSSFLSSGKKAVKRSGRVGVGGYFFRDQNGPIKRVGGNFAYAYHIFMQNTQLSFGLRLSAFQFSLNPNELDFHDNTQEPFKNGALEKPMIVPDVSFGSYLLTSTSYLGFSVTNLFQSRVPFGSESYNYKMVRNYFLMGGKRFNDEDIISYEPSFLLKGTEKLITQADLQMRFIYSHNYYIGLCFRTGTYLGVIFGARLNKINIGYSFDYGFNSVKKYSYGAHEINLALKFGDSARRYKWLIRY